MTMESTEVATVSVAARIAALQKKLGDDNRHKPRPEPETEKRVASACAAGRIAPFQNQQNTASYKPPVAKPIHVSTQAVVAVVEDGNNDDATAFSSKTPLADNTKKEKGRSSILRDATNIMRNGNSVKDKGYMLSSKAGSSSKEVKETERDQTEYVQDIGDKQAVLGLAYEHVATTSKDQHIEAAEAKKQAQIDAAAAKKAKQEEAHQAAEAKRQSQIEADEAKKAAQEEARKAAQARKQAQIEAVLAEKQLIAEEKKQALLEAKQKVEQAKAAREAKKKQAVLWLAYEDVATTTTTTTSGKDQEKVARSAEIIGVDKTGVVDYPSIKIEDSLHEVSLGDSLLEDSLLEDSLLEDSLLEDSLLEISLLIDDFGEVEVVEKNVENEKRSPLAAQRLSFDIDTPSKTAVSSVLFPRSPFSHLVTQEQGPKGKYQKIRVAITPIGKKKATVVTPSKEDANESINIQAASPFTQIALKSISRQEQKAVDENEKILLDLTSKEKNKEGDKIFLQQKTITFPATFLEWDTSSQAAGPAKDVRIRPNPKDLMTKGKKDADKRIRLLVTPKKRTINPNNKIAAAADSSLGQTQPLVEEEETSFELEVSFFSNNDDEGPMVTCGFENNMFVFHCSEDNIDSILEDVMTGISDVANIMFLGIDGVNRVFENSLGVATNLERAYKEEVKAQEEVKDQEMKSTGQVVTPPVRVTKEKSRLFRKRVSNEVKGEEVQAQELTSTEHVTAPTGGCASKEKSRLIRECVSNKLKKCMLGLRKKDALYQNL